MAPETPAPLEVDVVIVGAGFSGLGLAIALQKEGTRRYVVLEKGPGVGGTWRENRYPGCACDIPSHLYSYSFAQNPDWSHRFAPQREILAYLERCADEHGVRPHLRFGQVVQEARFDEATARWHVTTAQGLVVHGRHLALGVGGLHHPRFPALPGRERFQGRQLHSAQWDEALDVSGLRVAVVGTGASAIQVVPSLAPKAKHLTVFQRTPPWVVSREDRLVPGLVKRLFRAVPLLQRLARARVYLRLETRAVLFLRRPGALRLAEWAARAHLRRQVKDPALRRQLTPAYAAGCKRILLSDDYYPALQRPNVTLEPCAVREVTPTGVVTADGRHVEVDVIAWCTGFDVAQPLQHLRVVGRGGQELARDAWKDGIAAYRGTTVPGFPNLYLLMGPNTGLGHNSMVYMIESQVHFTLAHLRALDAARADAIEPTAEATRAFNEGLAQRLARSVWAAGCSSWYLGDDGKNSFLWPGFTFQFRRLTRRVDPAHVRLTTAAREPVLGSPHD